MNCHNSRITQKRSEETAIEEMDTDSKPIVYLMILVVAVVLLNAAFDAYAAYKYKGYMQTSELFSQALNGAQIDTGEGVITCKVEEVKK